MGVQCRKASPNPRVHRVEPRVGIFLSPLGTHDGLYLSMGEVGWSWRIKLDFFYIKRKP